jgi:hypothetical protein
MPTLMRIQKSRMWRVGQREREILGRKAAVATSRRLPWMRSLAMVRASPLGMSRDAAVWARTSATSRETQSLVSAAKANYSDSILERDVGLTGLLE